MPINRTPLVDRNTGSELPNQSDLPIRSARSVPPDAFQRNGLTQTVAPTSNRKSSPKLMPKHRFRAFLQIEELKSPGLGVQRKSDASTDRPD